MEQDELLQIYFSEADELLQSIEKSVMALEADPQDKAVVNEIFRAVHTIKSSSAMVGLNGLSEHSHLLENLLERLRNQQMPITRNLISFLLENHDAMKGMIERFAQGQHEENSTVFLSLKEKIARFAGSGIVDDGEEKRNAVTIAPGVQAREFYYEIRMRFRRDVFRAGQDPLMLLFELGDLGVIASVETDLSSLPGFPEIDPYQLYLNWRMVLRTKETMRTIEQVFIFIKEDSLNDLSIEDISAHFRDGVDTRISTKPLGEILVDHKLVDEHEIRDALAQHKKIGEVLVEEGRISQDELDKFVDLQEKSRAVIRKSTVRVPTEKLDSLANMIEEMTVQLAHVSSFVQDMGFAFVKKLRVELDVLNKISREIQEQVMRLRMFPIEGTFQRFQRMARDLARDQHKAVKVLIGGGETELDKDVIEQISDPLKHILRNCIDHGLETAEERIRAGKPEEGTISLKAYQQEGQIYLEINDDGRGIDLEAVLRRAREMGILPEKEQLQPDELYQFLFMSGFSTAKEVSSLSGRGVGMDVVLNNIQRLGGTVNVVSEKNKGTTITIKLPLTLAVIDGMYVRIGSEIFIIPLSSVLSSVKLKHSEVRTIESKGKVARFGDSYAPIVFLDKLVGTDTRKPESDLLVIFASGERQVIGLVVDEILDQQQVVIKNLEKNFRPIRGIAGGAIMADGSVALILDLHSLDHLLYGQGRDDGRIH
ncbi:MAG: chemotaxis protein CheA [Pseudomonadota bacterium]